jgi:hypothetical protein
MRMAIGVIHLELITCSSILGSVTFMLISF